MKWVSDVFEEPENSPITYGWFSKMFIEWISHETSSVQETVRLFEKD